MNRTEERLRAATRAAARTVPDGSAPPLRLPAGPPPAPARRYRPPRSGWRRAMAPLAAAAAVTAVVGVSVAVTHLHGRPAGTTAPAAALASVPPYVVYLEGLPYAPNRAVVRSSVTGRVIAAIAPPRPYRMFDMVSAIGAGDRQFVLMAQRFRKVTGPGGPANQRFDNRTPGAFFTLTVSRDGTSARLAALPAGRSGHAVRAAHAQDVFAVTGSPDGRKLALGMHDAGRSWIRVATLASGASRTWRWAAPGWVGEDKPEWQPLSWRDDSRTLAFQAHTGLSGGGPLEIGLLDTDGPGRTLAAARVVLRIAGVHDRVELMNVLLTGDGREIIASVQTVASSPVAPQATETSVRVYSARTGRLLRVLDRRLITGPAVSNGEVWGNVLWVSRTGSSMVLLDPARHAAHQRTGWPVLGVLTGSTFTPMPFATPLAWEYAW